MSSTTQFTKLQYESKRPVAGFDMWVAVWTNHGHGDVAIGAPSLDSLAENWFRITGHELKRESAQHVIAVQFNAPEALFGKAKRIASGAEKP